MNQKKRRHHITIPTDVLLDSDLLPGAKLLYVEIERLCDGGPCWASDEDFAQFLGSSPRTVHSV